MDGLSCTFTIKLPTLRLLKRIRVKKIKEVNHELNLICDQSFEKLKRNLLKISQIAIDIAIMF